MMLSCCLSVEFGQPNGNINQANMCIRCGCNLSFIVSIPGESFRNFIECIREIFPISDVFDFKVDDKPLKEHLIVKEHLDERGIDLAAEGHPTHG